jgi:glyceraldehyde-3-phosphate dehydrogenase (NADP+)
MKTDYETRAHPHPQIENIFLSEKDIPEEYRFDEPLEQTEYLVNGEIRTWSKAFKDVYSPICIQTDAGLKPKRLGKFPLLNEEESLSALDAAVAAYDSGRGAWPTMTVKDRVICMQQFVKKCCPNAQQL